MQLEKLHQFRIYTIMFSLTQFGVDDNDNFRFNAIFIVLEINKYIV